MVVEKEGRSRGGAGYAELCDDKEAKQQGMAASVGTSHDVVCLC